MKHYLDFEKPILELQRKLDELRRHPDAHSLGISLDEEVAQIERKIAETRREIFSNLTAWQRVQLARHPKRPYTLDYLNATFTDFHELHGDRAFADDHAVVGGDLAQRGLRDVGAGARRLRAAARGRRGGRRVEDHLWERGDGAAALE